MFSRIIFITFLTYIICANQVFSQKYNQFGQQTQQQKPAQQPQIQQQQPKSVEKPKPQYFNGKCPDKNGRYPVEGQCDAYVECIDNIPEEKLCADGLLFNAEASVFSFPCQYPIDVDCTTRARLQTAQPTDECPHQFGYFRLGDSTHCGQFMNCADGRGYTFDCPEGLAFHKDSYRCDWPDQVPDCDAEAFLGFTCPPQPIVEGFVGPQEMKFYASPHDCHHYYACIEGHPRLFNCGVENAFDVSVNSCAALENVTSCVNGKQVGVQNYQKQTTGQRNQFNQQPISNSVFGQSGGGFGNQKQTQKPAATGAFGSTFGQQKPQTSAFGSTTFGQQKPQSSAFGSTTFGQQKPQQFGTTTFGTQSKPQQAGFGQFSSFGQQQTTPASNRGNFKY